MGAEEKQEFVGRSVHPSGCHRYISVLLYHLVRLSLFIILFCIVHALVKQSTNIVIEKYEVEIVYSEDESISQSTDLASMRASGTLVRKEIQFNMTISSMESEKFDTMQCSYVPQALRFDCHPENGASESSCTSRGCCWNPLRDRNSTVKNVPLNVPYCYYPSHWSIYKYENFSQDGNIFSGFLKLTKNSFYKDDLRFVKVEVNTIDDSILRIKMYDPLWRRYEPPWPIRTRDTLLSRNDVDVKYKVKVDVTKPGFKVYRTADDVAIFDSIDVGGFIFADQFLQISALLPSHNIYGIGEHKTKLRLNTNWQSFTLFNKDQPPMENANLYGSHPFYIAMENSGKSHGVLFLNSNAMDVILQPSPAITFRSIGGIFDMYFFLGPSPADVIRQYSKIVGKPFLPPYWSLGFHLCRYGYRSLAETRKVWNRTIAAGIPFDTQWNDLDYMDRNNDFTYNSDTFKDLPRFVNEIHTRGMHYIPLIDAGISGGERKGTYPPYDDGLMEGVLVKNGTTDRPFVGKVWNLVSTVWPDFTHPKAKDYYHRMMRNMHDSFAYDGAWIDMNEPSNFYDGQKNGCSRNRFDYPPYVGNVVGGVLATKTLCMNAKHYAGIHYDLHNTYGTSQAVATNYALTKIRGRRPFIISRSTWVGHGRYAGHWTGDVFSTWEDLRASIPAILSMNFYQIPMVGADICGFNGNTSVALCNRWTQLGAFYPFSRNHNSDDTIEQDPVAMGELVVKSAKRALTIRYQLLPYLYTLFFRAHQFGETVARPLFFEFPSDSATYDIDAQFLWGSSLMIVPALEEGKTNVEAYVPRGLWYDFYTKARVHGFGKHCTLDAPLDTIPLMIRGGSIIPMQKPADTTTASRNSPFELLVALDRRDMAKGELYWDDGDSLDSLEKGQFAWILFNLVNNTLTGTRAKDTTFAEKIGLGKVEIWGITRNVSRVSLNGRDVRFAYSEKENRLNVRNLGVDLRESFSLSWRYADSELHRN